jgi:hypothetical protein
MDKEQIKELGEKIQDKAGDIVDGIKDRLDGECCDHEDHDCCIHPEHMIAEKAKEKVKELAEGKGSILDRLLGKVISRKLLVFATATVLLAQYGLDPDTWGLIAIVYIGGQSVIDAARMWRHGG